MSTFAANTTVSVAKSRAEIEDLVSRYGATTFASAIQPGRAVAMFEMQGRRVRLALPLPDKTSQEFTHYRPGNGHTLKLRDPAAIEKVYEQACRQRWRALALVVKAKLEAVESGIASFEQEFLAYIALPDGGTVGDFMVPQVALAYQTGNMPPLLGTGL